MLHFSTIYLERAIEHHPRVERILKTLGASEYRLIDDYSQIWGRAKKPYLLKREKLNLFLAQKKGQKVRLAPDAYGVEGEPHYYFVHAYNCIYECQYCYLQGYFSTPDLVWFINHEDIILEMQTVLNEGLKTHKRVWFHAGEFSDSLALSHLTHDLQCYYDFLLKNPQAFIELRTKSVNLRELKKLPPIPNLITSFSLSSDLHTRIYDLKTPSLKHRLEALRELSEQGYSVAIHLDPIIYHPEFKKHYHELIDQLDSMKIIDRLQYISLGVVRFTKEVFYEVTQNYPDSQLLKQPFIKPLDGKIRYPLYMRKKILSEIYQILMQKSVDPAKVYYCMENSFHLEA